MSPTGTRRTEILASDSGSDKGASSGICATLDILDEKCTSSTAASRSEGYDSQVRTNSAGIDERPAQIFLDFCRLPIDSRSLRGSLWLVCYVATRREAIPSMIMDMSTYNLLACIAMTSDIE